LNIFLLRYGSVPGQGTPGKLIVDDFECVTMEREWADNRPFVSCIPAGHYKLEPHESQKYGKTWAIVGETVSHLQTDAKRYACLIHSANYAYQLSGCIAPGEAHGGHNGHFMVTRSKATLKELLHLLEGGAHTLTIKWEDYL